MCIHLSSSLSKPSSAEMCCSSRTHLYFAEQMKDEAGQKVGNQTDVHNGPLEKCTKKTSLDLSRSKKKSKQNQVQKWSVRICTAPIHFYRRYISPLTPPSCRFTPTCSQYALDAYRIHGVFMGTWLTFTRILRCHPWHPGGSDPVIPHEQKK